MKILMLGDVIGQKGIEFLYEKLPMMKKKFNINTVIANGENSADGNGITPHSADFLFTSGVDIITTGNHAFRRREIYEYLGEKPYIIRPANYPDSAPGKGICYYDCGYIKLAVINICGTVFLEPLACPFKTAENLIAEAKREGARAIIIDFHAEATAEKRALALYLDGEISILAGTHTHVQTNDLEILPNGTGYITDIGMCGGKNSVLGVKAALAIAKMKDKLPVKFISETEEIFINGVIFEIDDKTGKTISVNFANIY